MYENYVYCNGSVRELIIKRNQCGIVNISAPERWRGVMMVMMMLMTMIKIKAIMMMMVTVIKSPQLHKHSTPKKVLRREWLPPSIQGELAKQPEMV